MAEMHALTIRQPWASAIAYGTKRVENREWRLSAKVVGEVIAIHAGKGHDLDAALPAGCRWPEVETHSLGAVIAVAEIAGCHPPGACVGGGTTGKLGERGHLWCSPWAMPGQFHIELTSVRPLPNPVPCRGMLGLWWLPEDVAEAVRAQLEASRG